jgi:DNA polymerase-3 subunit beta
MKLTIERAALHRRLTHVQSVVERRNTIPILSNVLIEAADGKISLTATDMDLIINDSVDAEVAQDGAVTAPAHLLFDITRKLPDGAQVEISVDGDASRLRLKSGRSNFALATLPKEDFPSGGGDELPKNFSLLAGELRGLIDRTSFAISTEETRYYLNGIYLHAAGAGDHEVLRAVATDGHRLARIEMPLPDGAAGMPGVIVPRKTIAELRKLIDDEEQQVLISLSDTKIRFAFGSTALTSKLIDGTFPDYERVIPSGNDKKAEVACKEFADAVDRVSTISTEKSRAVKMAVAGRSLVLSATAPDSNTASEELEVAFDGEDIEIGFNSRYLLDIARQIDGDAVTFEMADPSSPTILRDPGDPGALYVLMPMRV